MLEAGSNSKVQTSPLPALKISSIKWSEFKYARPVHKLGWLPGSAEIQHGREWVWGRGSASFQMHESHSGGMWVLQELRGTAGALPDTEDWRLFICPKNGAALQTLCLWAQKYHHPPLAFGDERGSWGHGGVKVIIIIIITVPDIYCAVTAQWALG